MRNGKICNTKQKTNICSQAENMQIACSYAKHYYSSPSDKSEFYSVNTVCSVIDSVRDAKMQ